MSAGNENEPMQVNPADKTFMKNSNLFPPKNMNKTGLKRFALNNSGPQRFD